jgi:hypothetical protein
VSMELQALCWFTVGKCWVVVPASSAGGSGDGLMLRADPPKEPEIWVAFLGCRDGNQGRLGQGREDLSMVWWLTHATVGSAEYCRLPSSKDKLNNYS